LRVPLIVVGRDFKPRQINRAVSLIDIFPFILETTGTRAEKLDIAGRSFYRCCLAGDDGDKDPDRPVLASGTLYDVEKYCLISGHKKLIFNSPEKKRPLAGFTSRVAFELYDLGNDPAEEIPLAPDRVKEFTALRRELERFIRSKTGAGGKKISIEHDKELQEKLKSLGYL
jgi:arylsulfatase A-like enzyme